MKDLNLLLSMSLVFLTACSTGHCRRDGAMLPKKVKASLPKSYTPEDKGSVFIAKADGSRQCGMDAGLSLDKMQSELKGIKVLSSKKASDGMMRVQVCGAPTGMMNIFEIPYSQLAKAEKKGFSIFRNK